MKEIRVPKFEATKVQNLCADINSRYTLMISIFVKAVLI